MISVGLTDDKGELKIVQKEAKIIERIYKEYLQGKSATRIAKDLEKSGIKTPTGRKRWGTKKYAQDMWMCMTRVDKGVKTCNTLAVHEEKLNQAFVRAINKAIEDKATFGKKIIENVEKVLPDAEEEFKKFDYRY